MSTLTNAMDRERGELIEPESNAWLEWTSVEDMIEHASDRIVTDRPRTLTPIWRTLTAMWRFRP